MVAYELLRNTADRRALANLIALSARRVGAIVVTRNRADFVLIRRHKGFALRVID